MFNKVINIVSRFGISCNPVGYFLLFLLLLSARYNKRTKYYYTLLMG